MDERDIRVDYQCPSYSRIRWPVIGSRRRRAEQRTPAFSTARCWRSQDGAGRIEPDQEEENVARKSKTTQSLVYRTMTVCHVEARVVFT